MYIHLYKYMHVKSIFISASKRLYWHISKLTYFLFNTDWLCQKKKKESLLILLPRRKRAMAHGVTVSAQAQKLEWLHFLCHEDRKFRHASPSPPPTRIVDSPGSGDLLLLLLRRRPRSGRDGEHSLYAHPIWHRGGPGPLWPRMWVANSDA